MQELIYKPRPCDRCGCGDIGETEPSYDESARFDNLKEAPMCTEFHLAYGLLAWLCYTCRRDWHKKIENHNLSAEYSQIQLRLDHWKASLVSKNPLSVGVGLELLKRSGEIEKEINTIANTWLIDS